MKTRSTVATVALSVGASVLVSMVTVPWFLTACSTAAVNTFSNGAVADAVEMNANFTEVKAAVDDNATAAVFSASLQNGDIVVPNDNWTLVKYDTDDFDPTNIYDTATGLVTPNRPGYWLMNQRTYLYPAPADGQISVQLYKNGAAHRTIGTYHPNTDFDWAMPTGAVIVHANGTTDTFGIYVLHASGAGKKVLRSHTYTWFQGHFLGE